MSEENVVKYAASRYEKFARMALSFAMGLMILVDIAMWAINEQPDKTVILVALIPMIAATVFVYKGRTQLAVWLFGSAVWTGIVYLTLINPQSYLEPASLLGRYLFPIILMAPIGWFSLEEKRKRFIYVTIAALVGLFSALYGHSVDTNPESAMSEGLLPIVNGMLLITILGLGYLVITNFRRGVLIFRSSISLKTGIGFFATAFITIGFIVFTVNTDNRTAGFYDYSRYADNQQILVGEIIAEIQGMRLKLAEYLMNYDQVGLDEAYLGYLGEYQDHYDTLQILFDDLIALHEQGFGSYHPGIDEEFSIENTASLKNIVGYVDARVSQIITLAEDRGFENSGLQGDLDQADRALDNLAAIRQTPELQVLVLKMRQAEKDWRLSHNSADAAAVNDFGEEVIAFLGTMEISAGSRREVEQGINGYLDDFNQVVDIERQITALNKDISKAVEPVTPRLGDLSAVAETRAQEAQTMLAQAAATTQNVSILFGVAAFVTAAVIGFLTTRTIVRPIVRLTATANEFAEGRLGSRAEVLSDDETGMLAGVFNQMADRLQGTLGNLEETIAQRTTELQERAREMEASQRVTFAASERTTPEDFLDLLVNLIADQFDVYHCQVYLVDDEKRAAVLSQSTGYAGRQLLQRGHSIPMDAPSLVTQCIKTGKSVLVAETAKDPNWLPNALLPFTQSELVVPLKIDDRVIGVMDIQDRVPNRFSEASVPVFESMTEHVAFLYENNELLENIAEARRIQDHFVAQLETTSEVAGQLATILDPTQLLEQAVTLLQSRFNFYHAHIYLADEERKNLVVATGSGNVGVILKERGHSIPIDAQRSFVAAAFRNAAPVRIVDTTQDPNWLPNPLLPDTRAEMALPLITRGQVIGVLDIQAEETGRFTEVDEDSMLTLAGQLATSVDTARLFVTVEQAAERDRTRFEIAEALSGNPTEEEVWDVLLEKALSITDDPLMLSLNRIERTEDGEVYVVSHRTASTNPEVPPQPLGVALNASQSPGFDVLLKGEMLVSNDVPNDDQFHPDLRAYLTSLGSASILVASFGSGAVDDWEGLIGINAPAKGFFNASRVSMFNSLIELGTVALRSARLRAAVAQAAERDRIRFEIAEALQGNPTEDQVWDILLEKASGDGLLVTVSLTEHLPDDDILVTTYRGVNRNPAMKLPESGTKFRLSENPALKYLSPGKIFITNDIATDGVIDPVIRDFILSQGVSSMMAAPFALTEGEEWQGIIRVSSDKINYFDPELASMYNSLIELGTVALRSAKLRAAVEQAAERDRKRFEIAEALQGNPTEEEVWDILLEKALGEDVMVVMNRTEYLEDGTMIATTHRSASSSPSLTPPPPGNRLNITQSPGYETLLRGEVFISNNIEGDERLDANVRDLLMSTGSVSLMAAAMSTPDDDEWLGFMSLASTIPGYFSTDVRMMYQDVVELGTAALRAARLRAEIARAAERDRTRFEIAEALSGNLTEEEVWDVLVEKARFEKSLVIFHRTIQTEVGDWITTLHRKWSDIPGAMEAAPPLGFSTSVSESVLPEHAERLVKGEAIFVNNLKTMEGLHQYYDSLLSTGAASIMAAPFVIRDELDNQWYGFVTVTAIETGYFDDTKKALANALIESGSVALRAAHLRAEADQERERFRVLIENAPEAIVVFNGATGEFMEANQNAVQLYEIPIEELIGNNPVALSPVTQPDGRASAEAAMGYIQQAIDGGTPVFDWLHRTGKGRDIPCEIRLVRLPGYDNPPRLRGSITDISDRVEAQEAIVQGDRLKSEFLANMSHELRTPLNSILGYTDVLLMGLDGELDEEVTTDLEAIHENSQHLLNLINDILDLAKIEAGRMTIELSDVDVAGLLNEVKKTSAGLLVNKEVEMVVEAAEELPTVQADYHRIYQVVNNLVSNAVKFTEKGAITLRAYTEGDEMILQVEDTGIGISKDDLAVIFEEFTQADNSSTRQHEGTGLGLTITRRLVQMHSGQINVGSELDKGSTFTVRLPLVAKVDPERLVLAPSSNGSNKN